VGRSGAGGGARASQRSATRIDVLARVGTTQHAQNQARSINRIERALTAAWTAMRGAHLAQLSNTLNSNPAKTSIPRTRCDSYCFTD